MNEQKVNKENMKVQDQDSKPRVEIEQEETQKGMGLEPSLKNKTKKPRKGRKKAKLVTISQTNKEGTEQLNQPREIEIPNSIPEEKTKEWV